MITIATTTIVMGIVFLAVAAVTAVVSVGAISYSVATSRKDRLARHESIRSYYGHLAVSR